MKRIAQVNSVCDRGSTGIIAKHICQASIENGYDSKIFFGYGESGYDNSQRLSSDLYIKFNILKTRLFGKHAFYSKFATRKLVRLLKQYQPDLIHIHQIHGHYLNIPIFFKFLMDYDLDVVITMHDCWMFTGHCAHFDFYGCDKWKTGCYECPQLNEYPVSWFFDRSKQNYADKKKYFNMIDKLHLITPSQWLCDFLPDSFLAKHERNVINNGIDINDFKKRDTTELKKKLGLEDEFIIVGMASKWLRNVHKQKTLDFIEKLDDDIIVILIGYADNPDDLPSNVIPIPFVNGRKELSEYYSLGDVFINLTLEDNFPTVNLESLSCGTPIITFDSGGSGEAIDENTGFNVAKGDFDAILDAVNKIKTSNRDYSDMCRARAVSKYDKDKCYQQYVDFFASILEGKYDESNDGFKFL